MTLKTRPSPTRAILYGGLIAGACDLIFAILFYGLRGTKPIQIAQSIASGLLGRDAFQGGWTTAALGVAFHFAIAISAASLYYLASRRLKILLQWASLCGPLYGAAIFYFMRKVVLPLSAAPHFKSEPLSYWSDLAVHVFFIGLPIALLARRYGTITSDQPFLSAQQRDLSVSQR